MIASGVPSLPFLPFGIAYFFVPEKLVLTIGLVLSFLLFIGIIYGILHGRWNWKVNTIRLNWNDLPQSDVLVVAVPHRIYQSLGQTDWRKKIRCGGVFIDVGAVFDQKQLQQLDLIVWRL
jgi:hypothetical protein